MKKTIKYILVGLSLLATSFSVLAQSVHENGITTSKSVSTQGSDGNYEITLETFATGSTTVVTKAAPADIVLVLDLSQSMTDEYGDNYVYEARNSQGYRYNNFNNGYYLHSDGKYYAVSSSGGNNNRRLQFTVDGTPWYLYGTTATTTQPSGSRDNATIWTGVLYDRSRGSRLDALKVAVSDFVEVIYHNDNYEDKTDTKPRQKPLGNRISIVTFGGEQGNTVITKVNGDGLTYVTNADGTKNTLMLSELMAKTNAELDGNNPSYRGTYADEGMVLANGVLAGIPVARRDTSSRTVVLFTDGAPGSGPGWTTGTAATSSPSTANRAIGAALTAKTDYTATVFTVILGGIANTDMGHYLDYTSSNYPEAESLSAPHEPAGGSTDYSLEAGNDLSGVFTTIANASGGSERPVDADTQVRDVVSSSFTIPDNFEADDVVFTVYRVVDEDTWEVDSAYDMSGITAVIGMNPAGTNKMLTVEGFDYSKEDNPKNSGNGNWVGERFINNQYVWKGRKLQIKFKIKEIDGATGGDATNTNTSESGVYVKNADGTYTCLNHYAIPHTNLPINLVIKKTGLKHGESATFEIERCRPKNWVETATLEENLANLEYNVIGKPKPSGDWEDWSKVIVTNKGADKAEVTKTLLSLDPHYVYRVAEDNWGWAYTMTGNTGSSDIPDTSTQEVNPFSFENTEKANAVKHAEAVTINHFGYEIVSGEFEGQQEEHYKSSKTKL